MFTGSAPSNATPPSDGFGQRPDADNVFGDVFEEVTPDSPRSFGNVLTKFSVTEA
jgi:hypothetical protein